MTYNFFFLVKIVNRLHFVHYLLNQSRPMTFRKKNIYYLKIILAYKWIYFLFTCVSSKDLNFMHTSFFVPKKRCISRPSCIWLWLSENIILIWTFTWVINQNNSLSCNKLKFTLCTLIHPFHAAKKRSKINTPLFEDVGKGYWGRLTLVDLPFSWLLLHK